MYTELCGVVKALPVMGTEADVSIALAHARKVLPPHLIVTVEAIEGAYKWNVTTTYKAPVWVRKIVRAVGRKYNGEFYAIRPSKVDLSGVKGIYYSLGRKRVER